MTSIIDEQKFIDANFLTIENFNRATFDELAAMVILTLAGILLNFDPSGGKFALQMQNGKYNQRASWQVRPPAVIRQRPDILFSIILTTTTTTTKLDCAYDYAVAEIYYEIQYMEINIYLCTISTI